MNSKRKYLTCKDLTNDKRTLATVVNMVSNNEPNKKIKNFIQNRYQRGIFYSTVALLRRKISLCRKNDLSLVDVMNNNPNRAVPLKKVNPINVLAQELSRIYRNSITQTISNSDKRELVQLLHLYKSRNYLDNSF